MVPVMIGGMWFTDSSSAWDHSCMMGRHDSSVGRRNGANSRQLDFAAGGNNARPGEGRDLGRLPLPLGYVLPRAEAVTWGMNAR